jgi:hypothetical protein
VGSRPPHANVRGPVDLKWIGILGVLSMLVLVAFEAGIRAHFGVFTQTRVASLLPATWEQARLDDTQGVSATYYPSIERIKQTSFSSRPPIPGEVILFGNPSDLLLIRSPARVIRLVARGGQRIRVVNLGEWDSAMAKFKGLDAVYIDRHWVIDSGTMRPVNQNSDLRQGDVEVPIRGIL